jgi:hypothetical protein
MLVTLGVMITWQKKNSTQKAKKAYCWFGVALRRPTWKSRTKNVNAWHYDYLCTEVHPTYVDTATESRALLDPIEPLESVECFNGGSCALSSTSVVEEMCHDSSGTE